MFSNLRILFCLSTLVCLSELASSYAASIDPLSKGPVPLTDKNVDSVRAAYKDGLIYTDAECYLKPDDIAATEVPIQSLPTDVCHGRVQELIYLASKSALVGCIKAKPEFAMVVAIGSNGIGKTSEGNRRSPLGTYWIGPPRHSRLFGIFIPIGYPNMRDIANGYTGDSIGIHGPMRFMTCLPRKSLEKNWTAGCFAVGRDSQIIALSEWVLSHWPVKLTITKN